MAETKLKIVRLTAENFMRLVAVEICPKTNAVIISSRKNGQGKSSVLDAIVAALGGKKSTPPKPIREGQDTAYIELETELFTVKRKFTEKGSYLTITKGEGFKASSPQALLDKIVGEISFDPLEFAARKPNEQRQILMDLAGLDFSDIEAKIAELKAKRSHVNEEKRRFEVEAEKIQYTPDLPETEISVGELTEQLQSAMSKNAEIEKLRNQLDLVNRDLQQANLVIESIDEQIDDLTKRYQEQLKTLQQKKEAAVKNRQAIAEKAEVMQSTLDNYEPIDVSEIKEKLSKLEQTNHLIRQNCEKRTLEGFVNLKREEFSRLGKEVEALEAEKARRLANAQFPIPGLTVDEEQVLYNGIPLVQVNEAKKLEICVAISMALNPKLRVLRMNGNSLDDESLAAICRMAEEKDYQVWIEKLDKDGKVGIVIEEGVVAAENPPLPEEQKELF